MIEYYDREQILSLISESWRSLDKLFKETPQLYEPTFTPPGGESKPYDSKSSIRKFGVEPYLQATLFAAINRIHPNSENFVLGVEGKKLNGKRPDILAWNPTKDPDQKNPYFMIELKVAGSALLKGKSLFKADVEKYSIDILKYDKTLFFFGCYYDGNPKDITDKVEEYHSILNWMIQEEGLSPKLKKSVIEGYAFRGQYKWIIIDNGVI